MAIIKIIVVYLTGFLAFIACDKLWFGTQKHLYMAEYGSLLNVSDGNVIVNLPSAAVVYTLLVMGIMVFVLPLAQTKLQTALYGGALGLLTYGVFNFTALAVIPGFTQKIALIDTGWGIFVCMIASLACQWVNTRWF